MHVCARDRESKGEREREMDTLEWSKGKFKDFPPWLLPLNFCFLLKYKREAGRWRQTFFFIGLDLTLGYFSPVGGRKWNCLWNSDCAFSLVVHWFFSVPKFTFSSMRDSWFLIWLEEWLYCENLGRSSVPTLPSSHFRKSISYCYFSNTWRILMGVIFVQGYKLLVEEQAGEEDRITPDGPCQCLPFSAVTEKC